MNTEANNSINWKKILLFLLILLFLFSLVGVGLYLLIPRPNEDPSPTTQPEKQATPSAKKDETADWKIYTGESYKVKFSLKYPQNLKAGKDPLGDPSNQVVFTNPNSQFGYVFKEGTIYLLVQVLSHEPEVMRLNPTHDEAMFAGLEAKRIIDKDYRFIEQNVGLVFYSINNQSPISADQYFVFECDFVPASDNNLKETCQKIADTFKFLD